MIQSFREVKENEAESLHAKIQLDLESQKQGQRNQA